MTSPTGSDPDPALDRIAAPPDPRSLHALAALMRPLERVLDVQLQGTERIPATRPLMFVGNHQLLALDTPLLMTALWRATGIALRPLADDLLFRIPLLRTVALRAGIVRASPDHCDALLRAGACVLVYPGGAREAAKSTEHAYELEWWDRLGFAQMAVSHRCNIVPVASSGLDSSVRTLIDREDYLAGPLRPLIDRLGIRHDLLPPVPWPSRRPRLTYRFAEPIAVDFAMLHDEQSAAHRLRSDVARAIESELAVALAASGTARQ